MAKKICAATGADEKWLDKGLSTGMFPAFFGEIGYTLKKEGNSVKFEASGSAKPANGFVLKAPNAQNPVKSVTINGRKIENVLGHDIQFDSLPALIMVEY